MRKEIITKDFLDALTLDEIRDRVNSFKKGSWHSVMLLDGSPISLDDGKTLYVTETFTGCAFNINYYHMSVVQCRTLAQVAHTPKQVATARKLYEKLKGRHPVFLKKTAEMIEHKEKLLDSGVTLSPETIKPKEDKKKRDPKCPAITYCGNGQTTLTFYDTGRHSIKSVKGGFEYQKPETKIRFFVKDTDGSIVEVFDRGDEKMSKLLEAARKTARAVADKRSAGESPVYSPRIQHVLNIW